MNVKVNIDFTEGEYEAIKLLSSENNLPIDKVITESLKLYQYVKYNARQKRKMAFVDEHGNLITEYLVYKSSFNNNPSPTENANNNK